MKIVIKPVYYCDHCKKRSLSKHHMRKHENGCTLNPKRICKLCDCIDIGATIETFKRFQLYEETVDYGYHIEIETLVGYPDGNPITLDEIRKATNNCPNCMLTIIRILKLNYHYFNGLTAGFDYKKEVAESFKFKTEAEREWNGCY